MTTKLIAVLNVLRYQVRKPGTLIAGVLAVVVLSGCAQPHNTSKATFHADELGNDGTNALDVRGLTVGSELVTLSIEPSEHWREVKVDLKHVVVDSLNKNQEETKGIVFVNSQSPDYGLWGASEKTESSPKQLVGKVPPGAARLNLKVRKSEDVFVIESVELRTIKPEFELIRKQSPLMSGFHGRPWFHEVYVAVPDHVDQQTPVLYSIDGFQENRKQSNGYNQGYARRAKKRIDEGSEIVYVYPNVGCEYGHHVMLDSEVNGPVGTAFVTELLPYIDDYLETGSSEGRRYVTGHSSGGWTVVHLMLDYPDAFTLGLATSPDPLDLHYFHEIDIYSDTNAFVDEEGIDRVFGRNYPKKDSQPTTWEMIAADPSLKFYPKQMISYEAAFGTPDEQGRPRKLFHRETGAIAPAVAASWKDHDLKLLADTLEVDGKAEVFDRLWILCGTEDNFGLHEGVEGFGMRGDGVTYGGRAFIEWAQEGDHWAGEKKANEFFREYIVDDARD